MSQIALYQLAEQTRSQMMSYVIRTGSGRLVVIDGGTAGDADHLLAMLRRISGEPQPTVEAWLLTHPHSDHIDALVEILRHRDGAVVVNRILHHFPTIEFLAAHEPEAVPTLAAYLDLPAEVRAREEILRRGQVVVIDDVTLKILYTTNPEHTVNACNNASTVFALTAAGTRVMFLADLGEEAGAELLATHGPALRSDIVQMAHHGQRGVRAEVYRAIGARLCLWPTPGWLWENNRDGQGRDSGPWKTLEVRGWMADLGVEQHVVTKDGTARLDLDDTAGSRISWTVITTA